MRFPDDDALDKRFSDLGRRLADEERLKKMADSLFARCRGERPAPTDIYSTCSLIDLIRLRTKGPYHSDPVLLTSTVSDYPLLFTDTGQRTISIQLRAITTTADRIALHQSLKSFKPSKTLYHSGFPSLLPVGESGEIKLGTLVEGGETIVLATYGRRFGISHKVFWNDDIAALTAAFLGAAERVKLNRNSLTCGYIRGGTSNNGPTCADGFQYFSTQHANLNTTQPLDASSLGSACAKLRKQAALDGTALSIAPRFLVVGPDLEVPGAKLLRDIGDQLALTLVVEPAITNTDFYVFADPALHPAFLLGTLGDAEPSLMPHVSFETASLEFQLFDSVGVGVGDWRAAVKTVGQT